MTGFFQDVRYGVRMMARAPAFTLIAILTLALGIGANTAMFSVVNAVVLRPLPFPNPNELMRVFHGYSKLNLPRASVSPFGYAYYREQVQSFSHLAANTGYRGPQNLTGTGEPERVRCVLVTASLFPTLGVPPLLGRGFTADEEQPGHEREAVLSYGLWQQRYGGNRGILGNTVTLDGTNYTVVGVMPPGFSYPDKTQLWVPLALSPTEWRDQTEYLFLVGRLKPGVTPQQAQAELAQVTAQVLRQIPELAQAGWSVFTVPMSQVAQEDIRPAALVLLGAVAFVLLIACANVANLLLTRATVRQKEIAVRVAMGAKRSRIIRQLLTESVLLALAAAVLGVMLAYVGVDALLALVPIELPSFMQVTVDGTVLLFALALAVVTGLLFGLVPAWHVSRAEVSDTLKETGRTGVGGARSRLRQVLVASEIAWAVMLLIGAGLLIRTFIRVQQTDLGFDQENVIIGRTSLARSRYGSSIQRSAFADQAVQRLATLPGVSEAAASSSLPLSTNWTRSYDIEGKQLVPSPHSNFGVVTPRYFAALHIPLLRGRFFADADNADAPPVAIVDQKTADTYWPGEDPIGQRINLRTGTDQKPQWRQVVGIVGSVKHTSALSDDPKGEVYLPFAQLPSAAITFVVRTSRAPQSLASSLRTQITAVDPQQAVFDVQLMDTVVNEYVAQPRFNMVLLGIFAGLALVLAAVGTYGVISYSVAQSSHEIGLRMALGATPRDVLRLVMGRGARLALIGLAIGIAAALLASRALASMLFGVRTTDLPTFATVVVLLGGVALVAMYLPARRATRVDPMVALRCE
jgi:predicted permease